MANGILIVDKPDGWTSQDVAAKLRGVFHEKRVGHGGTLDPMATGVLPIFIGRATRGVEFFESAEKEYIAGLPFHFHDRFPSFQEIFCTEIQYVSFYRHKAFP